MVLLAWAWCGMASASTAHPLHQHHTTTPHRAYGNIDDMIKIVRSVMQFPIHIPMSLAEFQSFRVQWRGRCRWKCRVATEQQIATARLNQASRNCQEGAKSIRMLSNEPFDICDSMVNRRVMAVNVELGEESETWCGRRATKRWVSRGERTEATVSKV